MEIDRQNGDQLEEENMRDELAITLEEYPEFLSSVHLVKLGIYNSIDAAYLARVRSNSPAFIKMKHKILYPKKAVIDFLAERSMTDSKEKTHTGRHCT